jgi:hypothetical protein
MKRLKNATVFIYAFFWCYSLVSKGNGPVGISDLTSQETNLFSLQSKTI